MTQPDHRPDRQSFHVYVGDAVEPAVLPEWWGAMDSGVQTRSLRFDGPGGNWIDEGELPPSLIGAGAQISEVVGSGDFQGLADAGLVVGNRVMLQPIPAVVGGYDAVGVWTEGRTQQVGWLPGNVAAQVMADSMRRGLGYGAFVFGEHRDQASGARQDISLILGPGIVYSVAAP
jgi:hypothetical protein